MKRDLVVLSICVALLASALLFSSHLDAVSVSALASEVDYILVLDAGHGGEDGGAVSASGDKESDINLSIVLKLDQLMGLCGIPTVLTRAEDRSMHDSTATTLREKKVSDLRNRVAMIESIPGAMLLSIHQNSYPDSRYSGAQVFYGSYADSLAWGESTQEILRLALNPKNSRCAKAIPDTVYLMNHISCPAILVECGFMTNGEEISMLLTSNYQKKIAAALAGAYIQYTNR